MKLNKLKVSETKVMAANTNKIPKEFAKYPFCLVATAGDCAIGGMGHSNQVLPFEAKHKSIVTEYLRAVKEFQKFAKKGDLGTKEARKLLDYSYDCFDQLKDAGIAHHKWHARTNWKLVPLDVESLTSHKPWTLYEAHSEGIKPSRGNGVAPFS